MACGIGNAGKINAIPFSRHENIVFGIGFPLNFRWKTGDFHKLQMVQGNGINARIVPGGNHHGNHLPVRLVQVGGFQGVGTHFSFSRGVGANGGIGR